MSNSIEAIVPPQVATEADHGTGPAGQERAVRSGAARHKWRPSKLVAVVLKDIAIGAAIPVILLILWQIAASAGYISPTFMPSPGSILQAFWTLVTSGNLLHHLLVSMGRAGLGFLIGGAAGLLLGLLNGMFRKAQYLLDPSIQALRLVPHLAIAPLIILWFGFGETSKIAIIVTGSFFPLYINTFLGIRNVDNKLFEVASILGFSPLKRLIKLIIPASLPDILIGMRISLAVSWIGLVVAELIGSRSGIGFLINEAKQNSETSIIFVGIIIFAVIGKLIDSFMKGFESRWLNWRDSYKG
ncbi:ABC transporter permease [Paenibacillus sp. YAF4_2]|uniref:ABC transporter permease n=1 Tax=Paenibacillus sp. YAF4_2 TaxID=3233085 RepID=UPI003F9CD987